MTVQGHTPTVAADDRQAAEQQLNEIYRAHWRGVVGFIWNRVDDRHRSHAEDLASDVFMELWDDFLLPGVEVYRPFGLLCHMARNRLAAFYKIKANRYRETAVDFSDPANRGLGAGHSYACYQPEVATLTAELDEALERMTQLSRQWRDKHSETHSLRARLDKRTIKNAKVRAGVQAKFETASAENTRLLEQFRQACGRVGKLRAELEAAGGPNWSSSTGHPASQSRSHLPPGSMSDPNRTHCDEGHELTLMNTVFGAEGGRRCRACLTVELRQAYEKSREQTRKSRGPAKPRHTGLTPEQVDQARELLKDPSISLRKAAALLGIPRSTLTENIDVSDLRDPQAGRVPTTPDNVIERALALLLDPDNRQSVAKVAKQVGVSATTLYARIPDLTARRHQVYGETVLIGANAR